MNGSIRVGSLFGIPFYLHPSWFLVLGLVAWNFGSFLSAGFPALGMILPWLLGLAFALMMFASVLAHELGHSFVAIAQGIQVRSITLFLFGGLASLEAESKSPAGAFWVAIAGPLVSFALFGLLTTIGVGLALSGPLAQMVALLAYINLVLGAFNLIPGLPLDGGNILKAIVWKITGNPYKGILFASRVGQFFGWLGISFGILSFLGLSRFGSLWTALIGWFLLQNAGRMAQSATVQEQLTNFTAADAIIPNGPIASSQLSLREFANEYVIGSDRNWKQFLIVDESKQLIGAIAVDALKTISTSQWPTTSVAELIQPLDNPPSIQGDRPLLDAIKLLEEKQESQLLVLGDNGILLGLMEKASIARLLQENTPTQSP